MVIKGKSRSNGPQLADYLLNSRANDKAHVLDIRGTSRPDDLKRSLLEMSLSSELTKRGKLGLYHAQVNPAIGEDRPMTPDDWLKAADTLERHLGFDGQKRVIVLHEKEGRLHGHVVWERYDHDTGKLRADGKNYKQHDKARAEIEQELGHERTPQRKEPELTHKEQLTDLWRRHPDGRGFVEAAEDAGYIIAQGNDRRPFRVVTPDGQSLDLVRQLEDIKTKEVRDRLQPMRDDLWTEAEALKLSKTDRQEVAEQELTTPEKSDKLRELSDSQSLAMAMINRYKEPKQTQFQSYSFTINQTLKTPYSMLYSDILAERNTAFIKVNQDYETARQQIKQMQRGDFEPSRYDVELERLETLHKKQVVELQQGFEVKKREFLGEAPPLPQELKEKSLSDNSPDISDNQDTAVAMLVHYRQRQTDRQNKVQEAREQAKNQMKLTNDDNLTDEADRLLKEYQDRQELFKQKQHRGRSL